MGIDQVRAYFKAYDMSDQIIEFDQSSETVDLAAQAVGCDPARIAKTLSFLVDGQAILIVTAGDAKIANPKYKAQFGTKAKMIPGEEVQDTIGHEVGGVCPFAIHDGVKVYLDVSLQRFQTVFPAAGSGNSAIELSLSDLERFSRSAAWIDVCKDWDPGISC